MNAGGIGGGGARGHGERPRVIGAQRIGSRHAVVGVAVVDKILEDRHGALFGRREVRVGRNHPCIRCAFDDRGVVVYAGRRAIDVVPAGVNVDQFGECDDDAGVARRVRGVRSRVGIHYGRTDLLDGRGAARVGSAGDEVVAVDVRIGVAAVLPENRRRVIAGGRSVASSLIAVRRRAVADEVDDVGIGQRSGAWAGQKVAVAHEGNLAGSTAHVDAAVVGDVRCRQRTAGGAAGERDQVILARSDGAADWLQAGEAPGVGGGRILHAPAGHVHRRGGRVVELDEVVRVGRAAVAAAAIELADDDVIRRRAGGKDVDVHRLRGRRIDVVGERSGERRRAVEARVQRNCVRNGRCPLSTGHIHARHAGSRSCRPVVDGVVVTAGEIHRERRRVLRHGRDRIRRRRDERRAVAARGSDLNVDRLRDGRIHPVAQRCGERRRSAETCHQRDVEGHGGGALSTIDADALDAGAGSGGPDEDPAVVAAADVDVEGKSVLRHRCDRIRRRCDGWRVIDGSADDGGRSAVARIRRSDGEVGDVVIRVGASGVCAKRRGRVARRGCGTAPLVAEIGRHRAVADEVRDKTAGRAGDAQRSG